MSQHYLLSAASRQLSLAQVLRMSDEDARMTFAWMRWDSEVEQVCPRCGVVRKHAYISTRKQWACKDCGHRFSVTSGTVFAHHKLSLQVLLGAIVLFVQSAKGMPALQLSRNLDVQYKTAFVLFHKLREALWCTQDESPLAGEVEMDAAYVHGYVRPKNRKVDRVDRRKKENLNPVKRAVLVMRERGLPKQGAQRSIIKVIKQENEADIQRLVKQHVHPDAVIYADEHPAYASLAAIHEVHQVNHQDEYATKDGVNQNQAESFFTRMRRMLVGQIHKNAPKHLEFYAHEIAWREDNRRQSALQQFNSLLESALKHSPSRNWSKYWQGNHLDDGFAQLAA